MTNTVLLLDIGNSRVKWAFASPTEWFADGAAGNDEIKNLLSEWDRFPPPASVMASNVAGPELAKYFSEYWQQRNVTLHWIRSSQSAGGVSNLYDRPQQLGSDRWAALIGAWSRLHRACLVVSAGTTVTVDALNDQGEFIGGLIQPGRYMMQKSLIAGTHGLEGFTGQVVDFPCNTADAMASGIATALSAAVHAAYQRLASRVESAPACIIGGGDAEWLANQLQIEVIIAPRLVLEGLLSLAKEDERT